MTSLVACIGLGKGTWSQVIPIVENEDWDKVLIVTNEFGKGKYPSKKQLTHIIIDTEQELEDLEADVRTKLKPHLGMGDVAVNLISGTGKEHMAVMAALLKLGAGIRLVAWDGSKIKTY